MGTETQGAKLDEVAIAIPAYRNARTLSWVVKTILRQSHGSLKVLVLDDGFADGYHDVMDSLQGIGDDRLFYLPNSERLGPLENTRKCFATVADYPYGMVLSGDVGLLPQSLEILIGSLCVTGAQIAFARANNFISLNDASAFVSASSTSSPELETSEIETISSSKLIGQFFGEMNIAGEYVGFSVMGALGAGFLFRRPALLRPPYNFHGWEFQHSMLYASQVTHISLLHQELRVGVTGLKKYAEARRPETDWTRIEPILATFEKANGLRKENANFSNHWSLETVRHHHLKLLRHYSNVYGQHKVVAWATRLVVLSRVSSPRALRFLFSILVRCRLRSER